VKIRECRAGPGRPSVTDPSSVTDGRSEFIYKIGLFGSNFLILSILFVDRDLNTYVFCFVGLPSIDMAKSIYVLSSIPLKGRKGGGVL
jgi:hypothetical protein